MAPHTKKFLTQKSQSGSSKEKTSQPPKRTYAELEAEGGSEEDGEYEIDDEEEELSQVKKKLKPEHLAKEPRELEEPEKKSGYGVLSSIFRRTIKKVRPHKKNSDEQSVPDTQHLASVYAAELSEVTKNIPFVGGTVELFVLLYLCYSSPHGHPQ